MSVAVASRIQYSHSLGRLAQSSEGFNNPVDVARGSGERLYVLNRSNMNHAPMGFVRITVCTVDETFVADWMKYGYGDGQIVWPTAIATDADDRLLIADEQRHDVQVLAPDGTFVTSFGGRGTAPGQFDRPAGVAAHPDGSIFVSDCLNHRVQRFSASGELIGVFGTHGTAPGQFNMPWGIEVDRAGAVYVVDWQNDRVQKLSADGQHRATFGSSGTGEGQLHRPASVSVDSVGNVYVTDYGNDRVQVFEPDGRPLTTLLGDGTMSKWGVGSIEVDPETKQLREEFPHVVARERFFKGPIGIEVDPQDRIFIADCCRHRVQVYQRAS